MRVLLTAVLLWPLSLLAQCLIGSIGVTGPGCGCLAGCNLSAYGGPICGPSMTGNCNAGYQYMSVGINLDQDCEARVEAYMAPRPGCSASGADGNSATNGDRMRLRAFGEPVTPWQIGGSNATLTDAMTRQGGQILVEGYANRADEIITYEVFFESGMCPFCILLPVELVQFNAFLDAFTLDLHWATASESNNFGFFVEISRDAQNYQRISYIEGAGTSHSYQSYTHRVEMPEDGEWYIRLAQQDYNGQLSYSPVVHVEVRSEDVFDLRPQGDQLALTNRASDAIDCSVFVFSPDGRMVYTQQLHFSSGEVLMLPRADGLSLVTLVTASGRRFQWKNIGF